MYIPLVHHFLPFMTKLSPSLQRVHSMLVASLEATSGSGEKTTGHLQHFTQNKKRISNETLVFTYPICSFSLNVPSFPKIWIPDLDTGKNK